jgi:hypothetical protein
MGLIAPEAKRSEVLLGGGVAQSAAVQGLSEPMYGCAAGFGTHASPHGRPAATAPQGRQGHSVSRLAAGGGPMRPAALPCRQRVERCLLGTGNRPA